jgi:hypothetical protein
MVCWPLSFEVPPDESQRVTVDLRDGGDTLYVEDAGGNAVTAERTADDTYATTATTSEDETVDYAVTYTVRDQMIEGEIASTISDPELGTCDVTRPFTAVPAE